MRVIVRVRLAPALECRAFERWLRAIPAVVYGALVTGDVDYEVHLDCSDFADVVEVLTRIRGCQGVEVVSTSLVLHEVAGLGQRRPVIADEVTTRRLRTM